MSEEKEIRVNIEDGNETKASQSDETPIEPTSAEAEVAPPDLTEPELTEEEQLRQHLASAEEKLLLTLADFENYKKRQARRQEEFYRTANDGLLSRLLDVVDNFERAIAHAEENSADQGLLDGTRMILKQLHDILAQYNVIPIEALGQPFDPNLHEALMQVDSDKYEEGLVALEIAKGYKAGDRVLRHSKVGVSKGLAAPSQNSDKNENA